VEDENRIPSADVPNLEATTTVNTAMGTMVCFSGGNLFFSLTTQSIASFPLAVLNKCWFF
jgi:hypothetical protein